MKENKMIKTIWARHRKLVIVSFFMIVAVFGLALFAWADEKAGNGTDGPEMQAGMGDITKGSDIYMGDVTNGYAGNQLKWTVLDPDKDNAGNSGAMFLFSKGVVAEKDSKGRAQEFRYYNGWMNPLRKLTVNNHWHHSSMPKWCDTFMKKVFTPAEQEAIRSVTKKEVPSDSIGPFKDKVMHVEPDGHISGYYDYYNYDLLLEADTIREQKVFFPSYDEIKNEDAYASMPGFSTTRYWLRSPGEIYPYYELIDLFRAFVGIYTTHAEHKDYGKDHSPAFEYDDIARKCMARPVMNIEKGSVIFSNVAGAKEGVNIGEMKELNLDRTDRNDWELSFEDPDRRGFDAKGVIVHSHSGNHTVEVKTSGAKTGENEYLSAIAMDEDDNILYYGRIKESTEDDAQFKIPVPWYNDREGIKLYVFNERYVGKEQSSSMSPLRYIDLDNPDIATHIVTFDLNGHGSPQPDWEEVEHGKTVNRPDDPFAVGFDFRGWFTEPETEISWDFGSVVQDNMTLYAGWAPHKYEIEYDSNGGGGDNYIQERTYQDANLIAVCKFTPPDDNMKFTCWNTNKNGSGMNYYPGDTDDLTYNEDYKITLYAQWSDELMVAYHLSGHGSPQPDSEFTSADKGWKITRPKDPSDKAYDFDGWYTTPGCDTGDAWDFDNDALDNSTTLFAKWNPHKYTVHFEPNGADGSVTMEDQHREFGDNVPLDNDFVWQSSNQIKFMEWNTEQDGTGTSYENGYTGDLTDKDGEVITLYAIWTPDYYDVDFDKNEGSGDQMGTQRRSCSEPAALSKNTYTREDYVFAGWNTEADGSGISYEDQSKKNIPNTTGSVRLYAQWVSEYTVHFDANGGNGKMPDVTRTIGDRKALPDNAFYRDSYTFGGWNTERDGSGTSYEDGFTGDLQVHADKITLYAQWDISYTIQYDGNGATGFMEDQKRKYGDGESLTPNGFSNEGFVFDSWNTREDGTGTGYADETEGDLANSAGTVVLYAQWKAETVYTITFDANGGSYEDGDTITKTTDAYGYLKEFAPAPQGPGGTPFFGWYSAKDGGVKVAEGARFTSDTTLYACWTRQKDDLDWDQMDFTGPFTVKYDPMGGSLDMTEQKTKAGSYTQTPLNQNRVYIIEHPTPQNEPFGFDGWYTAPEGGTLAVEGNYDYSNPPPAQYMSDTTLYAHWRPMRYTVRFNNNGGQGTMPDQHRTYDDDVKLAANTFIRTNYKFNGWNTDKDGHGMVYTDQELGNITDKEETVTLYAQWKEEEYIVVFDMNGVDASPKPSPYNTGPEFDFKVERPDDDPAAEGYTFGGWYKESDCINEWDFENDIVVDETTTLYAKWTGNPYTVKFDPGKGTIDEQFGAMEDQDRIVGDGVALPQCTYGPPKVSSGTVFKGWNTKKDGSGKFFADGSTDDVATGGKVTLYAQWTDTRVAVFDLNGHGSGAPAPQMRGEMHGYKVVKPKTDPTAKGYKFTGWYKDKNCTEIWDFDNDTLQKAVTTIYAGWKAIEYTVIFDANPPDGTSAGGLMSNVDRQYDDGKELPPVGFSIIEPNNLDEAYSFTGWNTEPDGSGDSFGDRDAQNITSIDGADITLYAMWDMAQITTTNLPDGMQDEYYEATLTQMGLMEESPVEWYINTEEGDTGLPEGLELDSETGMISGTTSQAGTFTFTVKVTGINLMGDQETLSKKLTLDIIQKEPEVLIIEFIKGMNGRWTKGTSSSLDFTLNGPFNMFTGLDVDGVNLVKDRDYTASEGSTVIKLKPEYLNKLGNGNHILTAHYDDGQAPFTQFTVVAKQDPQKKVSGTPLVKLSTKGNNSLILSWNKIQGADGYDIYFAYCGETSKYATTIKGNKIFSWTKGGLKKGRCYKAYVKAYVMKNGKKTFVKCSPLVLSYASGGSGEYTNAAAVKVEKASASLKAGQAFQIKPSIEKAKKNRFLMPKKFAPTFRYMTSNDKIATVSSGGKITAKGKGTCYIYVFAHNGVARQVKVTVK